jgi:hypothetical protein
MPDSAPCPAIDADVEKAARQATTSAAWDQRAADAEREWAVVIALNHL